MLDTSPVVFERGQNIVENRMGRPSAPTTVNSSVRTREYLTTSGHGSMFTLRLPVGWCGSYLSSQSRLCSGAGIV